MPRPDRKQIMALMERQGKYEVKAQAGTTHFYIYDEIGFWGVQARDIVKDIDAVQAGEIVVHLNSPGGDVWDGMAIYNALKRSKARVTCLIEGVAASIATIIALGAAEVLINRSAQVMVHMPWTVAIGDAKGLRATADLLEKTQGQMADIYAARMGIGKDAALALMDAETWYTGQEAVDAGFANALADPEDAGDQKTEPDRKTAASLKSMMAMRLKLAQADA